MYRVAPDGLGFSLTDFVTGLAKQGESILKTATELKKIRLVKTPTTAVAAPEPLMTVPSQVPTWVVPAAIGAVALFFVLPRLMGRGRRA